ncbi:MAG: hypothetical protein AB1609_16385 [Bacillota bacterium]
MTLEELYGCRPNLAWDMLHVTGYAGVVLVCEGREMALRYAEEYVVFKKPVGEIALVRCRDGLEAASLDGEKREARPVCPRDVEARAIPVRGEDGEWWLRDFRVCSADSEDSLARVVLMKLVPGVMQVVVADPVSPRGWRWLAGVGGISVVCFVRREDAPVWHDTGLLVARFEPSRVRHPLERGLLSGVVSGEAITQSRESGTCGTEVVACARS